MKKAGFKISLTSFRRTISLFTGFAALLVVSPGAVWPQEEVTSKIYRYRERVATGYYEGYEVSPQRRRALVEVPGVKRGLFPFGSASAMVRIRSRLPDSHRGLKFYYRNTCIECHPQQARNLHSLRAAITCRQCHGPEPIPSINHYFAPTNPIRRHAYICAKCHEGANASFASFYVHEPPSTSLSTRKSFPLLFYTSWGMLLLFLGTLAFFIPHSLMVGVRELSEKLPSSVQHRFTMGAQELFEKLNLMFHRFLMGLRKFFKEKKIKRNNEVNSGDAP
ncbi:MAG: hypothetical protein JRH18_12155 [Deltaproteobacteria bacterium]|nr:hypothetical protein [Deltaproteobacteria bacterium]MBW2152411.1 hypothetical protein [Deltaproteobacteria bacterium]